VEFLQGDINNAADLSRACAGIDTVFHTAALIKLLSVARPSIRKQVFTVNVGGTEKLLAAAKHADVTAFVHTSTGNVAMDRELLEKDETTPYATRTHDLYSRSKIAAEKLALSANEPSGMRSCAVRSGGVWGADIGSIMIHSFLEQLAAGRFTAIMGAADVTMDNSHIENLVDGQLLAAKGLRQSPERVGGQAYFIMDGERINPMQWFQPLAEGLGYPYPTRRLPSTLMKAVAWSMELAHYFGAPEPLLTVRAVRNLVASSAFKIDKARHELGYQPRYQRDSGIAELLPAARRFVDAASTT
jgi:3beta-hydroxy-delta5-steroid dehydrogenase/steroid delta-isomerase